MRRLLFFLLMGMLARPALAQLPDPLASDETALGIVYDLPINGRLDNVTPRAAYAFDGLRGEVVTITLDATSGSLDPVLTVLDNSGALMAHLDDSSGGRGARLDSLRLPKSERYYVIVGRFGYGQGTTTGEYTLMVQRIGVSSASGSALRYGDTVINQINDATPQLYYSFRAQRGDIISVGMHRISGNLDTYVQVVNSSAFIIADNDEAPDSGSLDAQISSLLIDADGMYVIIASRFGQAAGDSTGGFYLTLETAADSGLGNSVQAAVSIAPDQPVEGELNGDRFAQYFRFDAKANDIVTIKMERLEGGLDSFLSLLDSGGRELANNDDVEGSQNAQIEKFLIPASGTYTIQAARFEGAAGKTVGRYRLTMTITGNLLDDVPQDMTFIPYGSTITGAVDDTTPETRYAFYGQAGETITLSLSRGDGDLDPVIGILDAAGNLLVSDDDSGGSQNALIDRFTLPATGVYYVLATRFSGEGRANTHGSYILVLAQRFD